MENLPRGLSSDFIQEELDEPFQFKEPMTRIRSKRLEEQIYSKLMILQATKNLKDTKIMVWSTFEEYFLEKLVYVFGLWTFFFLEISLCFYVFEFWVSFKN